MATLTIQRSMDPSSTTAESAERGALERRLETLRLRYAVCSEAGEGRYEVRSPLMIAESSLVNAGQALSGQHDCNFISTLRRPTVEAWRLGRATAHLDEAERWVSETERRLGLLTTVSAASLTVGERFRRGFGPPMTVIEGPAEVADPYGGRRLVVAVRAETGSVGTLSLDLDESVDRLVETVTEAATTLGCPLGV